MEAARIRAGDGWPSAARSDGHRRADLSTSCGGEVRYRTVPRNPSSVSPSDCHLLPQGEKGNWRPCLGVQHPSAVGRLREPALSRRRDALLPGQQPCQRTGIDEPGRLPLVRPPQRLGHRAGVGADVRGGGDGGAVGVRIQGKNERVLGPPSALKKLLIKLFNEQRFLYPTSDVVVD